MVFSVTDFLASPEVKVFETLKKDDLIALGMRFGLDVRSPMKNQEIKTKVTNKLIEEKIFETRDFQEIFRLELETYKMSEMQYQVELEKIQLEREKLERENRERESKFELEKLDRQEREKEREEREKERELNFELEKLKLQHTTEHSSISAEFDAAKNVRLVPKFQEKSVDKYFPLFEK